METFLKYYRNTALAGIVAIVLGGIIGWFMGGTVGAVFNGAFAVMILSVLELSVSFDNAVLNATELENMNQRSRDWFMRWGILIAVVGMRLVFPILIVSVVGFMAPWTAFWVALTDPKQYASILDSAEIYVSSFGGSFLMMVALSYFLSDEKDSHWIKWIEAPLAKIGEFRHLVFGFAEVAIALIVVIITGLFVNSHEQFAYILSGIFGILLFEAIGRLKDYLKEHHPHNENIVADVSKLAIGSLVYLEVLDASMSFDGVIGAFAVTTEIFLVMLGLGVGAWAVRSMTVHLVEKKALAQFRYLEHGAQWAIGVLAALMFVKVFGHVPEAVVGLLSAFFIGSAVVHSIILNRKDAELSPTAA